MKQLLLVLGLLTASVSQLSLAADPPPVAAGTPAAITPNPAGTTPAGAKTAAPPPAVAAPAAVAKPAPSGPAYVQVTTNQGSFTIELFSERAPLTVAQFLRNVDSGFYSGTIFHRVIPNFIIQGGGFDASGKPKSVTPKVFNESGNGLTNQRGTVGMARTSEPHSGDSQFYVNLFDNAALDPNPNRWGYAVFGKIRTGMEVVDKIGNVATGAKPPFKEDAPLQPVIIEKVERVAAP
jgi:peptidyl-prolyl cis-trans isomerase A (cyclophilin A)/peptidyl-prolyl cis-trans isomerase B (cyclophilin B)